MKQPYPTKIRKICAEGNKDNVYEWSYSINIKVGDLVEESFEFQYDKPRLGIVLEVVEPIEPAEPDGGGGNNKIYRVRWNESGQIRDEIDATIALVSLGGGVTNDPSV